jgi:hypothetical protein
MVRAKILLAGALLSGCMIRSEGARDATLSYHPALVELRAAPEVDAARGVTPTVPRAVAAQIVVDGFAAGYPQPIGLGYDGDGAFRKVTSIEWADGGLEQGLAGALRASLLDGQGATVHLGGGVVSLARYRFGGDLYMSTQVEVRAVRDGNEIYARRYHAAARGGDPSLVTASLTNDIVNQIRGDERLFAAVEGGAQ